MERRFTSEYNGVLIILGAFFIAFARLCCELRNSILVALAEATVLACSVNQADLFERAHVFVLAEHYFELYFVG